MKTKRVFERYQRLFNYYRQDDQGNFIIEVNAPKLESIFSQYDPSPLHEKDIHPDVMKRILEQLIVFPKDSQIELHIHLGKKYKKKKLEADLERALRRHFEYEVMDSDLHLERRIHKGTKTFFLAALIFITFILGSYIISHYGPDFVIMHLLAEGLIIGAWVSLWHPIEMLLYDWLPLYEGKENYKRLRKIKIKFKYE